MAVKFLGDNSYEFKDFNQKVVDGFLRGIERCFSDKEKFIPSVIHDLCMQFYDTAKKDAFDSLLHGKNLKIDDSTVTSTSDSYETAFFSNIINSGIYKWKFKVIKCGKFTNIYIGIWDNTHNAKAALNSIFSSTSIMIEHPGYALNLRFGELRGDESKQVDGNTYFKDCPQANPGNIVEMVLEFTQKQ